jgi:hypothetical protein
MKKEEMLNKKIRELYHTEIIAGDLLPGVGTPYYFSIVFELQDGSMFQLSRYGISNEMTTDPIYPIKREDWNILSGIVYKGVEIVAVEQNDDDLCKIILKNGVVIFISEGFGDSLEFEKRKI